MTATDPGADRGRRPGSPGSLRAANRQRLLDAVRNLGPMTQTEVARATGLSAGTVSNLVHELTETGVLTAVGGAPRGRRGRLLSIAPPEGLALGVDVGHRHLRVVLAGWTLTPLAEQRVDSPDGQTARQTLSRAAQLIDQVLASAAVDHSEVIGVGLGLPAPIDSGTGKVGAPMILPGWQGVQAAEMASEVLGRPVAVDNDANLGALAETLQGAAQGNRSVAYIKISGGVGAGLVMDGQIFRGPDGTAGEIGHASLDEYGALCRCGNRGCLETLVRTPVLLSLLAPTHGSDLTVARMVALAHEGDIACRRLIIDAGRQVGLAAANMCNLLNPERIVLGGELSQAADLLIEPMRDVISRHGIPSAASRVDIVPAALGSRSQVLGAVALALRASERPPVRLHPQPAATHSAVTFST
jgi:predicted NBD/HSP70 family sugar kinase